MNVNKFSAVTKTLPIVVTATASSSAALPNKGTAIRVVNEGPNVAFLSIGSGSQTATLPNATPTITSIPVYLGETILTIPSQQTDSAVLNISAITRATETAQLGVQVGEGS